MVSSEVVTTHSEAVACTFFEASEHLHQAMTKVFKLYFYVAEVKLLFHCLPLHQKIGKEFGRCFSEHCTFDVEEEVRTKSCFLLYRLICNKNNGLNCLNLQKILVEKRPWCQVRGCHGPQVPGL